MSILNISIISSSTANRKSAELNYYFDSNIYSVLWRELIEDYCFYLQVEEEYYYAINLLKDGMVVTGVLQISFNN